jgi:hypothetical protein
MTFKFKKWKGVEVASYVLQLFAIRIIMQQDILTLEENLKCTKI